MWMPKIGRLSSKQTVTKKRAINEGAAAPLFIFETFLTFIVS